MTEISRRFFLFGTGSALVAGLAGPSAAFLPEIPEPEGYVLGASHPFMAKAWAMFDDQAGLIDCYNIESIERTGVGKYALRFKEGLFGLQPLVMAMADGTTTGAFDCSPERVVIKTFDEGGVPADPQRASVIVFGL